jgi:hypothetical protein
VFRKGDEVRGVLLLMPEKLCLDLVVVMEVPLGFAVDAVAVVVIKVKAASSARICFSAKRYSEKITK